MDQELDGELSEDLGYDLAHEVPQGSDRYDSRPARIQHSASAPHMPDADADYASDEAHDF